jgi:hypothetical protein
VAPKIVATYREAANVFEIMDNVSSWFPDKNDAQYREAWQARFGVTSADEDRFRAYKEIRKRWFSRADESRGGLFATSKPTDRIAEAFYTSDTLDAAYAKLAVFVQRPKNHQDPPKIIEEPLAVVHQKMFLGLVEPERLDFTEGWYGGDPWIGTFAKLIYEPVRRYHETPNAHLDEELMTKLGKSCAQLKTLASAFHH